MTDRPKIKGTIARQTLEKLRRKYLKVQERVPRNLRSQTGNKEVQERPLKNPFRRSANTFPSELEDLLPRGLLAVVSQPEFITIKQLRGMSVPPTKPNQESRQTNTFRITEALTLLESCLKELPEKYSQPVMAQLHRSEKEPLEHMPSQFMLANQNIEQLCDIGISSPKDHKQPAVEQSRRRRDSDGFL